jgi:hypothetical protein
LFPGSTFGYALQPLLFAVSWQCPAEFRFVNSSVKPFNSCTNQTLNNVGWSRAVLSSPISAERSIYGYISIDVPAQYTADDAAYIVIFNPNPLPIHLQSVKGLYVKDPVPMIAASGALMVILLAIMPFVSKYI